MAKREPRLQDSKEPFDPACANPLPASRPRVALDDLPIPISRIANAPGLLATAPVGNVSSVQVGTVRNSV